MEVCPRGFFCFDKNTFTLIVVFVIILIVYHINNTTKQFQETKQDLYSKSDQFNLLKNQLDNTQEQVNDLKKENTHLERERSIRNHQTSDNSHSFPLFSLTRERQSLRLKQKPSR